MVDFASGLMSFATGGLKTYNRLEEEKAKREQGILDDASFNAAENVRLIVEDAATTKKQEGETFNKIYRNIETNFAAISSEYGPDYDPELDILAAERQDLFVGDLDTARANVKNYLRVGPLSGDITRESDVYKSYQEAYGDISGGELIKQKRKTMNNQVRDSMSQILGANSTTLLLDPFMNKDAQPGDATYVSPRNLERAQEGRVSRESFITNLNQLMDQKILDPSEPATRGELMQASNFVPTATVTDMRSALLASGVTDPFEQNVKIMVQMNEVVQALKMQGSEEDATKLLVERGVITPDNIAVMQNSIQPLILANFEDRIQTIANGPGQAGLMMTRYLENKTTFKDQDLDGYLSTLSLVEEQMQNAIRDVNDTGYVDMVGKFVKTSDPVLAAKINPELAVPFFITDTNTGEREEVPGIIIPTVMDGMLKIVDYNGNALGTMRLAQFFAVPQDKDTTTETVTGGGYTIEREVKALGDTPTIAPYDAQYGVPAGNRIRELIYQNNGGQQAVLSMVGINK